jgi:probable HAF family extracellular repeat protein
MRKLQLLGLALVVFALSITSTSPISGQSANRPARQLQYRLVDLGTLGGPNSFQVFGYTDAFLTERALSSFGTFAGWSSTADADPYSPACFFDCFVDHAFQWRNGKITDLGALPGPSGSSSAVTAISANGLISGISENGQLDPLLPGVPEIHGVIWVNGKIVDLGTLRGGFESWANSVNDFGQAVGFATNTVADANSLAEYPTETRAILWQGGVMRDIGTLGGTDANALFINDLGQIAGQSYTLESVPSPNGFCGESPLTQHGFIWQRGTMQDIGTLGGSCALVYGLNNLGQIVGQSTTPGDDGNHPFLYQHGKIQDLGAFGGNYGFASWLNDRGQVVGTASDAGEQHVLGFLWRNGVISNLGTLPGDVCSVADAINIQGEVVGGSGLPLAPTFVGCTDTVEHAVLWRDGDVVDLNGFVPPGSDLTLIEATYLNELGEITGVAALPDGSIHDFLLLPCREGEDGCLEAAASSEAKVRNSKPAGATVFGRARIARLHPQACTRDCGSGNVTLGINIVGNGMVSDGTQLNCSASCSETFQKGAKVTLTASPKNGVVFVGWSGACSGSDPCAVTMNGNVSVTAAFSDQGSSFSLTADDTTLALARGGGTQDNITIASQNGVYARAVDLTCSVSGPAPAPNCAFASSSLTPGSMPVSTMLMIHSTASALLVPRTAPWLAAAAGCALALGLAWIVAPQQERRFCFALGSALAAVILMAGCSSSAGSNGNGGGSGPAPTTYTVSVAGDSGSLHQAITITVNQQ